MDMNIVLENFFRDLFNLVFNLNLTNANEVKLNYPGLDLIDLEEGVCIQITSNNDLSKIKHTLKHAERHLQNGLNIKDCIILFLGSSKKYHHLPPSIVTYQVWDFSYLSNYFKNLTIEEISIVHDFFRRQFEDSVPNENQDSYYSNDAQIYRETITPIAPKTVALLSRVSLIATIVNIGIALYSLWLFTLRMKAIHTTYIWIFMALFVTMLPGHIIRTTKKHRFQRLWKINFESDSQGNIFISKIKGHCYRCKYKNNTSIVLKDIKEGKTHRTLAICTTNPEQHVWSFDPTVLGDIDDDPNAPRLP